VVICDKRDLTPPQSTGGVGICRAADDSLLAAFNTVEVTKPDQYLFSRQGQEQTVINYMARSTDGGVSWSAPRRLDVSPFEYRTGVASKPVLLADKELFIPLETTPANKTVRTIGAFSSDNGETIGRFFDLALDDPSGQLNFCDLRFTVLPDRILAMIWTFRQDDEETVEVHSSVSSNNGRSWSRPRPVGFVGQITAPLDLRNGIVIAASNYRHPPEGIRLWLSRDGGAHWDRPAVQMWDARSKRILAEPVTAPDRRWDKRGVWDALKDFTFGTPDLVALADGTIILTYYATLDNIIHVRACRFKLDTAAG